MTMALRFPKLYSGVIPVDNAPVDAALSSNFSKYVHGMRKIMDAQITRSVEADDILKTFEEVRVFTFAVSWCLALLTLPQSLPIRQFLLTNLIRSKDSSTLRFRIPINYLAAALDQLGVFPFKNPAANHFDGPALFIRGIHSHYVPDDVLPVVGSFFPRFELRDVDSGHWVISERPHAFIHGMSLPVAIAFCLIYSQPLWNLYRSIARAPVSYVPDLSHINT